MSDRTWGHWLPITSYIAHLRIYLSILYVTYTGNQAIRGPAAYAPRTQVYRRFVRSSGGL